LASTHAFYNFTSTVLRTDGTRIELRGGSISKFGFDSQADRVRNGIELLSPTTIKIVGTRIDGSSGTHTRCVFDGGQGNSTLHIGDGSELIGQPMNLTAGMVVSREAIKNTSHVKRSSKVQQRRLTLAAFIRFTSRNTFTPAHPCQLPAHSRPVMKLPICLSKYRA
jgi:hypothetical protein